VASKTAAIIRTGGKQYRVETGGRVRIEKLPGEVGATIELADILLVGQGDGVEIGKPIVRGAKVSATITEQGRGAKLIVYKFRRRKNYRKKQGHRQHYTELRIDDIVA